MLPDVIGTWKFDDNRGAPGGSGPNGVGLSTSVQELQPVINPVSPSQKVADPTYLEVTESALEQTAVTPVATSNLADRTTILFDPSTMERRNNKGQVCL